MEKKHKELLIKKRCELVENINIRDGLYTQLITRKILNLRMKRTIQNGKTPDEQTEELLDILPTRGPEAFTKFCEALIADDQEHIVEEFLKLELQTAKPDNNEDNLRKRKRSPSPECLQIKDTKDGNLVVKFLSELSSIQCTEKPKYPEKISCDNFGEQRRYSLKHFIQQPVPDNIPRPQYIPVPTPNTEHHHYYYHPQSSELPSLTPSSTSTSTPTPSGLGRCDSIDAMHNIYKRYDSNGNNINKGPNPSTSIITESREEHSIKNNEDDYIDNDIDLTDGPVTSLVHSSTRQFYITHHKQSYPMKRMPRGRALIINVNEVKGKTARKGTDIDRDNLHYLLLQLHFNVLVYNDKDGLTAKELYEKVAAFSQLKEHGEGDACFIGLLSHGEEGYIYGTDGGMLGLNTIFDLFNNNKCPQLKGKPKIFIIQACRGGSFDRGASVDETDGGPAISVKQLPTLSDMIIGYPTQTGYYAWRNRERGSWYIEALVHVFIKHAKHNDICTLLNRVNSVVSRKISRTQNTSMDQMSQMSEYTSSLRCPHLYFFPGLGAPADN